MDRNKDGNIDVWSYSKNGNLVLVKEDRNGDGMPDQWSHFKRSSEQGSVLVKAESDNDFDGIIDETKVFEWEKIGINTYLSKH